MAEIVSRLLSTKPRISIASAGRGEFIVFLHGLGSTKENWRPQLDISAGHTTPSPGMHADMEKAMTTKASLCSNGILSATFSR